MSLSIIILAAGQGMRMCSNKPKVLHLLAGRPLLAHVFETALSIEHREIYTVYGYGGEQILKAMQGCKMTWIRQQEQLGTGHAVKQVLPKIPDDDDVLILYGDVPLITKKSLLFLIDSGTASGSSFSLLTVYLDNPKGYGRVIRDKMDNIKCIIEEKDADDEQQHICEINTGVMVVKATYLKKWISTLQNNNKQKEYYLTDIVAKAVADQVKVNTILADSSMEVKGINNHTQLAETERYYQLMQAHRLMDNGLRLMDPSRFDLRGKLEIGRDDIIDINVVIEGRVKFGNNVNIGVNCYIKDSLIADGVTVLPNTMIDNSVIGKNCRIGPFARIRPETMLDDNVHIGNFVELKKTDIGEGSKVNHLTYLGNTDIGKTANIGAGTITCNYDGVNKHQTIIGDDVFVGSDVQLIAPIKIASGATIAAGTTVTKDVVEDTLAISRTKQHTITNWKRPKKK